MRQLRCGLSGHDVYKWQLFLRGFNPYSALIVNGVFDEQTSIETKSFQRIFGLQQDGIVGNLTLAKALDNNFFLLTDISIPESIEIKDLSYPNKPNFDSLTYNKRIEIFGSFSYKHTPIKEMQELITITDGWQKNNISLFEIPQLKSVNGAPRNCKVLFHNLAGPLIVKTFQDWEDAHLSCKVLTWAGSFTPRFIRGSRTVLSNHAFGTAFDINAQWNGLGQQPALVGKMGCVRDLVSIANNNGLFWGGHWKDRPDGMHFEVAIV